VRSRRALRLGSLLVVSRRRVGVRVVGSLILAGVLGRACRVWAREGLIPRNVARLVELPQWQRATIRPWTADEAKQFLTAARPDPLHSAFVLLVLCGLRRGEALGLHWTAIGFEAGTIQIRQQLQRVQGQLVLGRVKTRAGQRDLPILDLAREALEGLAAQAGRPPCRHGLSLATDRPSVHHPDRAAHRAAQPRPVLPPHL
jgi:integrase